MSEFSDQNLLVILRKKSLFNGFDLVVLRNAVNNSVINIMPFLSCCLLCNDDSTRKMFLSRYICSLSKLGKKRKGKTYIVTKSNKYTPKKGEKVTRAFKLENDMRCFYFIYIIQYRIHALSSYIFTIYMTKSYDRLGELMLRLERILLKLEKCKFEVKNPLM